MIHKSKSVLAPEYINLLLTNSTVNSEKYLDRSSDVWTERSEALTKSLRYEYFFSIDQAIG